MVLSVLRSPLRRACLQRGVATAAGASLGLGSALDGPLLRAASAATATPDPLAIGLQVRSGERLHPANPLLVGSATPWVYGSEGLMDAQGAYRPGMLERAREMGPTVLRYPAVPDTHFWRQGIGPLAQRQPVFAYPGEPFQKIVYGTLEFLETCEALDAQPLIQVNMHDGDDASLAQMAADWVRFVNKTPQRSRRTGQPLPTARYWELGNEPYLMEAKLPDGAANRLHLRPEQFARRVNAVMAAMLAVDPTLRLGLPFATDTYSGRPWRSDASELGTVVGEQLGYADKLLAGLVRPQDLHFLALHYYMPLITGPADAAGRPLAMGSDEALYWSAAAGSETLRRHLQLLPAFWANHPRTARLPPPRLAVTEYNAFFTNARSRGQELKQNAYVMTQAGALFVADLLRVMSMEPRIEAGTQWSLNGNWVFGALSAGEGPPLARPVHHAMRMYRSLLAGGQMVPVDVSVASTAMAARTVGFAAPWPDMPLASAVAARDGKLLKLMVINKDPRRAGSVRLVLRGDKAVTGQIEHVDAPGLFAAAGRAEASLPRSGALQVEAGGHQVACRLPAASFGLITLQLA